jgi:hypothetical protein
MKILRALPIGIAPVILMGYGWYLGQLHQSGPDIVGILLFFTGAVGLALGIFFAWLIRKFPWHEKWYVYSLSGLAGCGIVFAMILAYVRWHG